MSTFNGWTNYATWNVALWMGNEESLNTLARRIAAGGGTYRDLSEFWFTRSERPKPPMAFPSPTRLNLQELNDCLSDLEALRSNPSHLNHVHPLPLLFPIQPLLWIPQEHLAPTEQQHYPRVEYAQNYNSSKGTYFKGGTTPTATTSTSISRAVGLLPTEAREGFRSHDLGHFLIIYSGKCPRLAESLEEKVLSAYENQRLAVLVVEGKRHTYYCVPEGHPFASSR